MRSCGWLATCYSSGSRARDNTPQNPDSPAGLPGLVQGLSLIRLSELVTSVTALQWTQVWTQTGRDEKERDGLDRIGEGREGLKTLRNRMGRYATIRRRAYFKTGALNHSATLPNR